MDFPILKNHNKLAVVGTISDNGTVTMFHGYELTKKQVFDTFGNVGIEVYEMKSNDKGDRGDVENYLITKFRITHWNIDR